MKTIKEMIEVMQAYVGGKKIECRNINDHSDWLSTQTPAWDWLRWDYRVKPVSKYRPYETTKELINDYIERFQQVNIPPFVTEQICPPIYLKSKKLEYFCIIEAFAEAFADYSIKIDGLWCDLADIFENYEFVDGSPVGKLEAN